MSITTVVTLLLRSPQHVVIGCRDETAQRELARVSILILVVGAAIFGAAVGSYRGGLQIGLAAVKVPIATLIAIGACGPAFAALAAAFDRPWGLRMTLAVTLCAAARSALVLVALSPPLWLLIDLGAPYHATKLFASAAYALGGLSALALLLRALGAGRGRVGAAVSIVAVYAVVAAQSAWLLRPYIGDPRDREVPTFAASRREGGVIEALRTALGS